jgi:hypothetical protein
MGFSVSRLGESEEDKKKKGIKDNRVDRSDLLSLARKFEVAPTQKKTQSLDDFLKEEGK